MGGERAQGSIVVHMVQSIYTHTSLRTFKRWLSKWAFLPPLCLPHWRKESCTVRCSLPGAVRWHMDTQTLSMFELLSPSKSSLLFLYFIILLFISEVCGGKPEMP